MPRCRLRAWQLSVRARGGWDAPSLRSRSLCFFRVLPERRSKFGRSARRSLLWLDQVLVRRGWHRLRIPWGSSLATISWRAQSRRRPPSKMAGYGDRARNPHPYLTGSKYSPRLSFILICPCTVREKGQEWTVESSQRGGGATKLNFSG